MPKIEGKISPASLRHNHTHNKKKQKMAKSDELATKEMPFRCYVGYDSHEDITFEVRAIRSLLRFPLLFESNPRVLCFFLKRIARASVVVAVPANDHLSFSLSLSCNLLSDATAR